MPCSERFVPSFVFIWYKVFWKGAGNLFFKKMFPAKTLLLICLAKHCIHDDAEDESGGDGSDGDLTEIEGEAADTADEDGGDDEQVAVLFEVDVLDHLETGDGDEAVEGDTDAAHDARRDGVNDRNERGEERDQQSADSGGDDRCNGCVAGDGDARDGFAVGGVRTAAEERAHHGADAVTEKGTGETGIFEEVLFNDGGDILVVSNMFCKDNERNGDVCRRDGTDVLTGEFAERTERLHEGERRDSEERGEGNLTVHEKVREVGEVDDLEGIDACRETDDGEESGNRVACADTDDERDQTGGLLTEGGREDGHEQGHKCAENADERTCRNRAFHVDFTVLRVADGVSGEGETDDRNGRTDNHGGHELVDPVYADLADDEGDDHINEPCHDCTDDHAEIAERDGSRTRERRKHGIDEGEGGAEEDGALPLGEGDIDESTAACTEESGGRAHFVADDDGYNEGRSHDCEKLLDRENDQLTEFRLITGLINEFHKTSENKSILFLTGSLSA